MLKKVKPKPVTKQEVLDWLQEGAFTIADGEVYTRAGRQLVQRLNKRKGSERGDARVDLKYGGKRRSINVSHLVWMWGTNSVIPDGYEIHHMDEDPTNNNFDNLVALHPIDHAKMHATVEEPIPF
jgi:hypothetical protein